ncbi:MAG: molybdopterin molybdotransferase MoeA [Candidatus Saccharibacteria bacterium]|nr:molybdopterin molybdotransferase MoeA [Pseudorhodobacter sp.]
MISVEDALTRCLALAQPLGVEPVALRHANGRMMPAPAYATLTQPPFAASAMDGYAVVGDPTPGTCFTVVAEAGAGHAFDGTVSVGQAVRIFTGAPLPQGASRVIIQEDVIRDGDQITVKPGADTATHIRPAGQDFRAGDALPPRRLTPNDLALLAAMNFAQVPVTRRPTVALIATGDELVMPGEVPAPSQIIASNTFALAAMIEAEGGIARILPIARDTPEALRTVLTMALDADLIITIGGASVGDHDLVAQVTAEMGMERAFWRIAMRPGKPLMAGTLHGKPVLGLPGNPVSAIVCGHLFVLPMVRALQARPNPEPQPHRARLGAPVDANGPRAHYMRARLTDTPSGPVVTPFDRQDSALLSILSQANALLIRPVSDGARSTGDTVNYLAL